MHTDVAQLVVAITFIHIYNIRLYGPSYPYFFKNASSFSITDYLAISCCYSSVRNKAAFGAYPAVLIKAKLPLKSRRVWLD